MSAGASPETRGYVVPRYRAEGAAFYHFLHGTVPGHQIDFMYCPEVPQGALRQVHVGHLARLIKYIEPRDGAPFAFAIGNLSRDDVQHSPGHGGMAVLFALRVPGVVDHAGRDMPPYAHGVVAVDRQLGVGTLVDTVMALYRHFLEREGAEDRRGDFYRSYVRTMRESPGEAADFLAKAIRDFDELPSPSRSTLGWDYVVDEGEPARQIALVHDEPMEMGMLAHRAATIAALLYRSNIKWTSISTGWEHDIAGGTTIRFVSRGETRADAGGMSFELEELPDDEEELAALLFGARRRLSASLPAKGWREMLAGQRAGQAGGLRAAASVESTEGAEWHETAESAERANGHGQELEVEVDVDDAAATIPVAALPGVAPESSLSAARTGRPRSSELSAPAVTTAGGRLPEGDGERESENTARRGRTSWRRVPIATAIATVVTVVIVIVVEGLKLLGSLSPPAGEDAGVPSAVVDVPPAASSQPAASSPPAASNAPDASSPPAASMGLAQNRLPPGRSARGSSGGTRGGAAGVTGRKPAGAAILQEPKEMDRNEQPPPGVDEEADVNKPVAPGAVVF